MHAVKISMPYRLVSAVVAMKVMFVDIVMSVDPSVPPTRKDGDSHKVPIRLMCMYNYTF